MLRLEDYNKGLIYTDIKGCIDYNKCIHECPILKSNVYVLDSDNNYKVCVDEKECILCGTCIDTCVHDVRQYIDDCDEFLLDLKRGKKFSVLIAPAFYLIYPNEYKQVLGYLKSLGIIDFYSVGFGADITIWDYLNYIADNNTAGLVAQPCPAVVSHIEKHMPELLPSLIPVQSPVMCTAIYLNRYKGIQEDLAFLSPCIAKKVEIESKRGLGLIRHNVTFKNLMEHIKKQGVNLSDYPCVEAELIPGMGSLFPNPGGLRANIEYYLGSEASIIQVEGERRVYEFLKVLYANTNKQADFMCEYDNDSAVNTRVITEAEIEDIFDEHLMKLTDDDRHVDCSACGYKTCRQMAEAIAHGINHRDNCVYYVKNTLAESLEEIRTAEEKLRITTGNMLEERAKALVAEENSQAKSKFLANMSHEIRTPMNAILGVTEIQLQKSNLDNDMKEALEKIYISGDMLLGIINDILDLSKIEAGKMELLPDRYEIASLISDTAQLNIMRIGSKEIEFEIFADEDMPEYMFGDELRIKQILNNILSNAFKYTDKGIVKMSVHAETDIENPERVVLVVAISDTGQGMSKEQVDKLFEEYSQFNLMANRSTEGTGLGMTIANNLIRMMDGKIFVESEPGVGSTFTVHLPQGKSGEKPLRKETADNLRKFRASNRTQMKRVQITREPMPYGKVLVVDDVETNIYVAKGLLAPYELQIDSADSGFAAIDKIKKGKVYDIVFMDHMMPQMDGIETTKRLREMGYTEPIVALTANALAGQSNVFLGNGFDDFISKPIDLRQINLVLNKLVRDKQPPDVIEEARRRVAEKAENAATADIKSQTEADYDDFSDYLKSSGIYERVYKDFARSQKNIMPEIMSAFEANDFKTAHRLAHTLKGLAGLIGETKLVLISGKVEAAFYKGDVPTELFDDLNNEVEDVLARIAEQFKDETPSVAAIPADEVDKDAAKELFDKLVDLLAANNVEAMDMLDGLSSIPQSESLISQIENFDFDLALESLNELRQILEV